MAKNPDASSSPASKPSLYDAIDKFEGDNAFDRSLTVGARIGKIKAIIDSYQSDISSDAYEKLNGIFRDADGQLELRPEYRKGSEPGYPITDGDILFQFMRKVREVAKTAHNSNTSKPGGTRSYRKKFNRCVKAVRKTVKARPKSSKESAAIAICTKSVLHTRGLTMKRYKKKRLVTQKKFRGGCGGEWGCS